MWMGQMAITGLRVGIDQDADYQEGSDSEDETLIRLLTPEGKGQIGPGLAPDNRPTGAIKSQFLAPQRPKWVEFPAYDSAVPNGVFFVVELIAHPPADGYPSNLYPLTVTLTSETPDVDIRYTIDGSTPTLQHGETYSTNNLPSVPMNRTLKAKAFKQGYTPSVLFEGRYVQARVENPTFDPPAGNYPPEDFNPNKLVILRCATPGATIYWSLQEDPVVGGHGPAPINVHVPQDHTIHAYAIKQYYLDSYHVTATYHKYPKVQTPVFTPDGGSFPQSDFPVTVTVTCPTAGATMKYTLNDTEVLTNGKAVKAPPHNKVTVEEDDVLRCIAQKTHMLDSDTKVGTYNIDITQVSDPGASPGEGDHYPRGPLTITLGCSTPHAKIAYAYGTYNGPDPDKHGTLYDSGDQVTIQIDGIKFLKLQAYLAGLSDSRIVILEYDQVHNGNGGGHHGPPITP
jgi:hypothetical protein